MIGKKQVGVAVVELEEEDLSREQDSREDDPEEQVESEDEGLGGEERSSMPPAAADHAEAAGESDSEQPSARAPDQEEHARESYFEGAQQGGSKAEEASTEPEVEAGPDSMALAAEPCEREEPEGAAELAVTEDVSPEEAAAIRLAIRAASYSEDRVRTICESLLLVADRPLNANTIRDSTGIEPRRVREAMEGIAGRFREGVSGVVLHEVAGGWQLRSCPTNAEDVRRFLQVKPQRLTRAALETLAIIAYRQPVTRPEVEEIRGVDSGAVLKALLDRGVIQVIGKKEEPGRPLLYATTRAFLELFNLKDLASLPTLRELHELTEESARIVEESFPDEAERSGRSIADLVETALSSGLEESRNEDESALEDLDEAVKAAEEAVRGSTGALEQPQAPEDAAG